jgi:hypothetical protein
MPLVDLLNTAGITEQLTAVLLGGYFGSWLPAAQISELLLAPQQLADHGASLGAGISNAAAYRPAITVHIPPTSAARRRDPPASSAMTWWPDICSRCTISISPSPIRGPSH